MKTTPFRESLITGIYKHDSYFGKYSTCLSLHYLFDGRVKQHEELADRRALLNASLDVAEYLKSINAEFCFPKSIGSAFLSRNEEEIGQRIVYFPDMVEEELKK